MADSFAQAQQHVKEANLSLSNEQLLQMYGLYKQATMGDCTTSQPSAFAPKKRYKWDAWTKQKGVTFSILNKIHVNGPKADPLFVYLKSKLKGSFGSFIKWNFTKFICNKNGIPIKRFGPTTPPSAMEDMIGGLLNEELTTVRMERSMSGTTSMATTRLLNEQHQ